MRALRRSCTGVALAGVLARPGSAAAQARPAALFKSWRRETAGIDFLHVVVGCPEIFLSGVGSAAAYPPSTRDVDGPLIDFGLIGLQGFGDRRRQRLARWNVEQPLMQRAFDGLAVDVAFGQESMGVGADARRGIKATIEIVDGDAGLVVLDADRVIGGQIGGADGGHPDLRCPCASTSPITSLFAIVRLVFVSFRLARKFIVPMAISMAAISMAAITRPGAGAPPRECRLRIWD